MMSKKSKILRSLDSNEDSESNGSSPEANSSMGENCRVTPYKRKACKSLQSPSKKPRGTCGAAEVAPKKRQRAHSNNADTSEQLAETGTKRKASSQTETASKKQRSGNTDSNSAESTKVSVQTDSKKEARAEQLPAPETPRMTSGCEPSLSSSSPLTSTQNNGSTRRSDQADTDFEAKYLQLNKLGEGGFGSVYAGTRKTDHLPVAIKHIPKADVRRRPVNIIKQLVEAAIGMHSTGVFHRDIKTENVLLETGSDVPRVRLIDFGCSCLVKKTPYCSFAGTSAYVPPEFFIRGTYQAAPTTVWQLGALLYELLDGNEQFSTSTYLRTKMRVDRKIKELSVSQDCQDFLRMCLAVNPRERATLEQMQLHPWFTSSCRTHPPNTTY